MEGKIRTQHVEVSTLQLNAGQISVHLYIHKMHRTAMLEAAHTHGWQHITHNLPDPPASALIRIPWLISGSSPLALLLAKWRRESRSDAKDSNE